MSNTGSDSSPNVAACPASILASSNTCKIVLQLDLLPVEQLQRYQDRLEVIEVVGDLWYFLTQRAGGTCVDADFAGWGIGTILRYSGLRPGSSAEEALYNPWDTGAEGASGDPVRVLFNEGDFTAPAERIVWQKHMVYDNQGFCSADDPGAVQTSTGQIDFTNVKWPVDTVDVNGNLIDGTGTIGSSDTCNVCPFDSDFAIANTISSTTQVGGGNIGVLTGKVQKLPVRWKGSLPLKGNDKATFQWEWGDPFNAGQSLLWDLNFFGYLKTKIRLA